VCGTGGLPLLFGEVRHGNGSQHLPSTAVKDKKRMLSKMKEQLGKKHRAELSAKRAGKYHHVRFFERKKVERQLKQVGDELQRAKAAGDASLSSLEERHKSLLTQAAYVRWFPRSEKYISLFMTPSNPLAPVRRDWLLQWALANAAAGEQLLAPPKEIGADPGGGKGWRRRERKEQQDGEEADDQEEGEDDDDDDDGDEGSGDEHEATTAASEAEEGVFGAVCQSVGAETAALALARVSKQTARQAKFTGHKTALESMGGASKLGVVDVDDELGGADVDGIEEDGFFLAADEDHAAPEFVVEERPEDMEWDEDEDADAPKGPEDWRRHYMRDQDQEFWFKKRYRSQDVGGARQDAGGGSFRAAKRPRESDEMPAWKDPSKSRSERRRLRGQMWEGKAEAAVASTVAASSGLFHERRGGREQPARAHPTKPYRAADASRGPDRRSHDHGGASRGPDRRSHDHGGASRGPDRRSHDHGGASRGPDAKKPKLSSKRTHLTFD
jgi:hypothetical protein